MSNKTKWILIGAVVAVLGAIALVGGVAGLGYYGWTVFVDDARVAVDTNAVVQEHLGVVQEFEADFERTGAEPDPETFAFRVRGVRGSGTLVAQFRTTGTGEQLGDGRLELDDGSAYDLATGEPLAEVRAPFASGP